MDDRADRTNVFLRIDALSKTFNGVRVLSDIGLELRRGEVHALLGQNGSGKSTAIKILAGYHAPDDDALAFVGDRVLKLGSATAARDAGIRFIHQDLGLISELDVIDNLALGERFEGRWWLSGRRERTAAQRTLAKYGVALDVTAPLESLSPAERTMVAIVRAIESMPGADGMLVLDEPTAALADEEVQQLFGLVAELKRRGLTILYVTHRLAEVFEIGDRVTVLRDGMSVGTRPVSSLSYDALVEMIVGRPLSAFYPESASGSGDTVLRVSAIGGDAVADVSLELARGEIVGVAGVVGSGYDQLLSLIFGGRPRVRGEVEVDGATLSAGSPGDAIAAGIAFAPADRRRLGAMREWTVRENITLPRLTSSPRGWLGDRAERADVRPWIERLDIRPAEPERLFALLSGGNQQKAVLARWLRSRAGVVLLDEPTNGVDVGAKRAIYEILQHACASGTAFLLASSDAEELCAVCDRVIVLRDGRVGAVLHAAELSVEALLTECMRETSTSKGAIA